MGIFALALITFLMLSNQLFSQDFESKNYPMSVGPEIGFKAGINAAEVPDGTKNGVSLAKSPDFGLQFYMPFQGQNYMGLLANIGYYNFPYKFTYESTSFELKYNTSYIGLGADFYVSGFTVGINYGFPSAATIGDVDLNTETLAGAFEFRLGAHIPMMVTPSGRLNLNIRASYFVTGQLNDNNLIGGKNTNPAAFMFGLSYLYNLQPQDDDN